MVVTAEQVYAPSENNMDSRKPDLIVMRFDLTADPVMNNAVSSWYRGTDNLTYKTAYHMTQALGPEL
ncbi:hypothetical protein CT19425_U520002 [Cupriavidus taiwanensis]|nr:hypothetical protein CT19425_U520002 [Cupriavidus taiwanensis]